MRKVTLADGVDSSVLGFGCAPVLGAVGAKVADRALNLALDGGVTHFDVARSYGYGEAEAFLGKFFAGRRDDVVIASKFGIKATWKAGLMRPFKPLVRALKERKRAPKVGSTPEIVTPSVSKNDHFHERVPITPDTMVGSLHESLQALRTDYLDIFFVHEPTGKLENMDRLVEMAENLKKQGKIRGLGLALNWHDCTIHAPYLDSFDILQFNNSPEADHYSEAQVSRQDAKNVIFSPFRDRRDLSAAEILRQLWTDFPSSVVLCSMFDPEHICSNIETAKLAGDGH